MVKNSRKQSWCLLEPICSLSVCLCVDLRCTRMLCCSEQVPRFSATDGKLYFITDTNGWWNLYREDSPGAISALCPLEGAEFGGAAWSLGASPYAFLPDGRLICRFSGPAVEGGAHLGVLDPSTSPGTLTEVVVPPNSNLGDLSVSTGAGGEGVLVATVGGSSAVPAEVRATLFKMLPPDVSGSSTGWEWTAYRASTSVDIDVGCRLRTIHIDTYAYACAYDRGANIHVEHRYVPQMYAYGMEQLLLHSAAHRVPDGEQRREAYDSIPNMSVYLATHLSRSIKRLRSIL